jgi:methylaspartate mutase epsilon subunit
MYREHAPQEGEHTIALGGIGGDAHSVGLTILRQALSMSGYHVYYLGTQNRLEDFFRVAPLSNVVMISSMDGHGRYYLRGFPELVRQLGGDRPLWYVGGNLHLGDGINYEHTFLEMGFDRAFVKFVDIESVLEILKRDLDGVEPKGGRSAPWRRQEGGGKHLLPAPVSDELFDLGELERARREVLETWKTGHAARSLDENAEFLARQPSFVKAQDGVRAKLPPILVQPRSGVSLVRPQIKLFKAFKSAGADVLSYQVDSLTRNNNYAGAEEAIRESRASGVSSINGFPVVNHGVPGLRRVVAEVKTPLQTRHSTRDPRLLAEISYAGGVTSFEGGAICYNIPYYRDYPLDESVNAWQYVDRLTGLYHERFGIVLDREFFGTLTATLIPPCLAIVVNVIQAVLAVKQGVKSVSLGYAEQGNRVQDVATIRTLAPVAERVLGNLGHTDVRVSTVFHQYMAAFPETPERSRELIYNSAITAALSGATRVIAKTCVESLRIPTVADNAEAINLVRRGVADAASMAVDESSVAAECAVIEREVHAILESIVHCGRGSIAAGVVEGFRRGFLDVPFSPSIHNRGEVVTARDSDGAVRFLSTGNLQLDRESKDFHRAKMQERRRAGGLLSDKQNYLLVERDVLQIARGQYERWPLSG